jgi:hypothetical protein
LAEVGPPGLVELLQRAGAVRQPHLGNWLEMTRPPRSNTRKTSAGGIVSHDGIAVSDGRMPFVAMKGSTFTGFSMEAPSPSRVYTSPRM